MLHLGKILFLEFRIQMKQHMMVQLLMHHLLIQLLIFDLQKICSIRGVNFNLKGQKRKAAGIIAQEVIDVIPEVVNDKDKDKLSADYNSLVGYLIESVKELKNENDSLKEENNTMKELLVKLNNDVSNIKRELGIRI